MVSTRFLLAGLAAMVSAAPTTPCKPKPQTSPTLPKLGGSSELPAPAANLTLKKIAIGHGIQNYTCGAAEGNSSAAGAVAVLYDATSLFPGTGRTALSQGAWDSLPSTLLRQQALPLNKLSGTEYGADPAKPFPQPTDDLRLSGLPVVKFLGYHYFDSNNVPMFDVTTAGLKASVTKRINLAAPNGADKGILNTGAVDWLELGDSGKGLSQGLSIVYRVVTAGGAPQPCSVAGVGLQSVPYTTYYWFYG